MQINSSLSQARLVLETVQAAVVSGAKVDDRTLARLDRHGRSGKWWKTFLRLLRAKNLLHPRCSRKKLQLTAKGKDWLVVDRL